VTMSYNLKVPNEPTIIELSPFNKNREAHLDDNSFRELQAMLIADPERGDVIEGTGGVRKLRYSTKKRNSGKSGGIRIIYFYVTEKGKIYLVSIIDKVKKENITKEEANLMRKLTKALKLEEQ